MLDESQFEEGRGRVRVAEGAGKVWASMSKQNTPIPEGDENTSELKKIRQNLNI